MEPAVKRTGSVALLVGLVLLGTAAGVVIFLLPVKCGGCMGLSMLNEGSRFGGDKSEVWICSDCDGSGKVSIAERWRYEAVRMMKSGWSLTRR